MDVSGDSQVGTVTAGYRLEALLVEDDAGAVYLADDLRHGRQVAVRLLSAELTADARFRERLLRESQLVASLGHPGMVPVYEAGDADGRAYVAMEHVEGTDLGSVLAREGRLEPPRALAIVEQLAEALDAARWGRGLAHGSLRPDRVLVVQTGSGENALLGGFGLRRQLQPGATLPEATRQLGPPGHLAPEQIEGRAISPRTDVYALGCVIFECLTGMPPFVRDTAERILEAHLHEPPPSVGHESPILPAAVDAVIAKAMAKWPEERYSTCAELAESFEKALTSGYGSRMGAHADDRLPADPFRRDPAPQEVTAAPSAADAGSEALNESPSRSGTRRRTLIRTAGLVALLALAAALAWLAARDPVDAGSVAPAAAAETTGEAAAAVEATAEPVAEPEPPAEPAPSAEAVGDAVPAQVVSLGPATLVRIDGSTGRVLARTAVPPAIRMASDGRSVWVLGQKAPPDGLHLIRVDAATNAVTDVFEAGLLRWRIQAPGLAAWRGSAWLGGDDGSVYRLGRGDRTAETVAFGEPGEGWISPVPDGGLVAAAGSLWVAAFPPGPCCLPPPDLYRVDPATGEVVAHIADATQVVAGGRGFVWALGENVLGNRPELIRIDTRTNATAPIGVLEFPWADVTVAAGAVWASDPEDSAIVRLDPVSGEERARIRLGGTPGSLAAGGGAVWAVLPEAGAVVRYDLNTGGIDRIDVGGVAGDVVVARGSVWVAVQPLATEEWIGRAGAICSEANDRFEAAIADLDLDSSPWSLEVMQAYHKAAARFSGEALAELRPLPRPADRAWAADLYSLFEQTIDVLRQVAVAAAAGDAVRAEELSWRRVDLTHQKDGRFGPGLYGCPVSLPA
jgi:serine/threonine-protein kinase